MSSCDTNANNSKFSPLQGGLVKFVLEMGADLYIDELCSWHSGKVNPCDLSMSHTYYEEVSESPGASNELKRS